MAEKKTRKSPVPQDAGRILAGALKLSFNDRVSLRDELTASIEEELKAMEDKFNSAKKLLNGKQ